VINVAFLHAAQKRALFDGCPWNYGQVRDFVMAVTNEAGTAWTWALNTRMKEALIAEHAFAVVRSAHRGTVSVEAMDRLLTAMRVLARLVPVEDVIEVTS
jgi:hypothetical protein